MSLSGAQVTRLWPYGGSGHQYGSFAGKTEAPPPPPAPPNTGGGRARPRRRRVEVEVDGQVLSVSSEAEAVALLEQARELAETAARRQAEIVVRKRATKARRTHTALNTDPVSLPAPYVKPLGPSASEFAQRLQAQVDAAYAAAARDAELALHMRLKAIEDEEDAILTLLLNLLD